MEIATIIISALALLISIISVVKSSNASKTANDLIKGQVEMQIRSMITVAKEHFSQMSNQLASNPNNEILINSVSAALEDVANAYDEACSKYLDMKVDKERFKKTYVNEIRNLVESNELKDKYTMPQSKFNATVKVYNEWNNFEQ